jgi:hypothetical protein
MFRRVKATNRKADRMKDIAELFGYPSDHVSRDSKLFWDTKSCPFTGISCSKKNHDGSVVYGTCSVSSTEGNVIICPNRLYADGYMTLRTVASDVFGDAPFFTFPEYLDAKRKNNGIIDGKKGAVIALGHNSGREVSLGNQMSMDWVLAHVKSGGIDSYTGVEVQSIDITGNYRDNWHYYQQWRNDESKPPRPKPSSAHGYNWANVHKRLIPQLIRKGLIYSRSAKVNHGLSFVLPDVVFKRFEKILGDDFQSPKRTGSDVLTVYTYVLNPFDGSTIRSLKLKRKIQITLSEFSERFVSGPNLPDGSVLDQAVSGVLGLGFLKK